MEGGGFRVRGLGLRGVERSLRPQNPETSKVAGLAPPRSSCSPPAWGRALGFGGLGFGV